MRERNKWRKKEQVKRKNGECGLWKTVEWQRRDRKQEEKPHTCKWKMEKETWIYEWKNKWMNEWMNEEMVKKTPIYSNQSIKWESK